MKLDLQKISLRLSLLVMAFLCSGTWIASGQENAKVMHKITYDLKNMELVEGPAEVGHGETFTFRLKPKYESYGNPMNYSVSMENSQGHLEEDKKEPKFYKISNVTGDVVIHVTGYGKAVIGGYAYSLDRDGKTACINDVPSTTKNLIVPDSVTLNGSKYRVKEFMYFGNVLPKSLASITFKGYIPVGIASYLFDAVDKDNLKIIVPKGAGKVYKAYSGLPVQEANISESDEGVAPSNDLKITYQSKNVSFDGPESVKYGEDVNVTVRSKDGTSLRFSVSCRSIETGEYCRPDFLKINDQEQKIQVPALFGDLQITIDGYEEYKEGVNTYELDKANAEATLSNYKGGSNAIIPSLLTVGGIDYAVTKIQHSFGSSLDSLTVPASVKGMGSSIRNCVNLRTIKLSSPLMPGIDVETLKSVDTLTCKILVPEGCLDVYKNNDFWGKFKNIEEYDPSIKDSYTITYDLKNISLADTVKSIQRNSTLNLTLLALEGYELPDSVEVNVKGYTYDKAKGTLSVPSVLTDLKIVAEAVKLDSVRINQQDSVIENAIVGDIMISNETAAKDTATIQLTNVTAPTLTVTPEAKAELALSGTNRLGEIKNEGVLILSSADEQAKLVNTTVENAGIFADSVGLISEVSGTGALAIAPIGDKTVEEGSSIDLMATAVPGESYTSVIFQWQRLGNGTWIDKKTTTKTPAPQAISLSLLRAAEPLADSYKVEAPEVGTYRCVITCKVSDQIATTLTTLSKVTAVSSEPDPVVTFSVVLPSVEGASLNPSAGTYSVEEGGSFSFSLTLEADYNQSTPIVKVGDKVIEPASDGKYEIKGIASDITISITGIMKNATVGNAELESNDLKVWGSNGVLHIRSAHAGTAYLVTFGGQLYKAITLPVGETMITIPQGSYIIRIENQSYKIRF